MHRFLSIFCLIIKSSFSTWSDFDYDVYLDDANQFKLYWTEYDNNTIELGMEVNATGWIAMGISPNSQMPHSDIMFGWISDNGTVYLQDRYTTGRRSYPLYDSQQDLTLISGQEIDGMTMIRFTRPKVSCDQSKQDLSFNEGTTRILYAFNKDADPTTEFFDQSSVQWHGLNKGAQSLNLDTGIPQPVELESDAEYFDLVNDAVTIPAADTTYWCKLFELPVFEKTHHIIKIAPVVDNVEYLHHVITYVCPKALGGSPDNYDTDNPCDDWDYDQPAAECFGTSINYAWAVGGEPLYYPKIAGMPLSGDSNLYYMVLQLHYNNPQMIEGVQDSSGIRIWHTPTLRQYDAGLMSIGAAVNPYGQFIPPGIDYTINTGFCTSDCTKAGIRGKDIVDGTVYAFGSVLHAHTIAVALNLQQIRNGIELPNLDKNWAYDFNYQQTIMFDEPKEIRAGDEFIMNCYMNSTGRDWITVGGESTSEEMCLAFIYVYPAPDLGLCWTQFTPDSMMNWLKEAHDRGYLIGNITAARDNWDWDELEWDESIAGSKEFYETLSDVNGEYKEHYQRCVSQNGSYLGHVESYDDLIRTVPIGFKAYEDTDTCGGDIEIGGTAAKVLVIVMVVVAVVIMVLGLVFIYKCFVVRAKKEGNDYAKAELMIKV